MKFPKARTFFVGMRKRIYGIFGRKICATATPSKSKQSQTIGHHRRLPMELECESTSAIKMDLRRRHRKLPAELNRQIFLCFNLATQRKFIGGLGWDFYAMFRHSLLTKTKRVCNIHGNRWNETTTRATVAADGLSVNNQAGGRPNVFAEQGFPISRPLCRVDEFPGTICYYYEVKADPWCTCGLTVSAIPDDDNSLFGRYSKSYFIQTDFVTECYLAGDLHQFELREGVVRPRLKHCSINVFGFGLVLDPDNKLAIFFTLNGQLLGQKIQISPTVELLFPAVTLSYYWFPLKANFGDDPAKPFEYDIKTCPGLELACI